MSELLGEIELCYETGDKQHMLQAGMSDQYFIFQIRQKGGKITFEISPVSGPVICKKVTLEINLKKYIQRWRNHNYQWVTLNTNRIANEYSPKILQLVDGTYIQAGNTLGCWEVIKNKPNVLQWHYHVDGLNPVSFFNPYRFYYQPTITIKEKLRFDLLITQKPPIEWSRSPYPFSAIFCLTDHCDFDSLLLLRRQRQLLKECNIKISKGFFLYHYSKRDWNVAYEDPCGSEELHLWKKEGHELFFHSLTQSIRQGQTAWNDFLKFFTPDGIFPVRCWVDHGYHPYNFTMQKGEDEQKVWLELISKRGLNIFWNYYDTTEDVHTINQISVEQFCPYAIWKLDINWREKLRLLLYYQSDQKNVYIYRLWAGSVKSFLIKPNIKNFIRVLRNSLPIIYVILKEHKRWILRPHLRNNFCKFAPLIFNYPGMPGVKIFQTIAVKNFAKAFSKQSLEALIQEAGVCIAHTYLSCLESHHVGRLFINEKGEIKADIYIAWKRLGDLISEKKIWNPVLSELEVWFDKFSKVFFTMNEQNEIIYTGPSEIPIRTIHD